MTKERFGGMTDRLSIKNVDFFDGHLVIVDLSDGTTLEVTLDQLLSVNAKRSAPDLEPGRL
jgi:hypothetical protein